jgi:hypothetical protein
MQTMTNCASNMQSMLTTVTTSLSCVTDSICYSGCVSGPRNP